MKPNVKFLFLLGAVLSAAPGCNGLFGGRYDRPEPQDEYGFIRQDAATGIGTVFINTSSYTDWTYLDLKNKTWEVRPVGEEAPDSWSFAVHRYDTKTNGGAVLETEFPDIPALTDAGLLPAGTYTPDRFATDRIAVDMSGMMAGIIKYAESDYNDVLSRWLDVDTSTMPPVYTLSGKVYLLRMNDGTLAAIRLENFVNDENIKGYMTIRYLYPVELPEPANPSRL